MVASAGLQVVLIDKHAGQLDRALATIRSSLDRLAGKGKLADDPADVLRRLDTTINMDVSRN